MPGKAPDPAGLTDREGVRLINNENLELRLQLQQLQSQLKLQQLYQVRHSHLSPWSWQSGLAVCISACIVRQSTCAAVKLHH